MLHYIYMKGESQIGVANGRLLADDLSFAIAAAHELKAPLALIRQLSLSLEQEDWSEGDKYRMLRQIVLTSERALRLTSDLTKSSRLQNSLFELEPINPMQLCEDAAHELWPLYKAKEKDIRVITSKRRLLAVGNRDLLRRIIVNFGENALSYADSNEPVVIHAKSLTSKEKVQVCVRDYGPAVPSNLWRTLSEQLGRAPQTLHNRPASSGLGLYINGQFASAMNGSIGAMRHKDGATFYVELPASHQLSLL